MGKNSRRMRNERRRTQMALEEKPLFENGVPGLEKKGARALHFDLVNDAKEIPAALIESIPDREYQVADFYSICTICLQDPLHLLFAMRNGSEEVKGLLWFNLNPLVGSIFVSAYAVDPEYRGGSIPYALELIRKYHERFHFKGKIAWATTQPELYEKHGMKRSKFVVMEA